MKKTLGAILLASALSFSFAGCDIPEDTGTAADRSPANAKKADAKKPGKAGKAANATKAKAAAPQESVSQENARESAESYLDVSAHSREGLIDQLEFEGFSEKDAIYGVDAQKADWNKQAAASAQSYLDVSSFSRAGLVDQLLFEGYTRPQAEYGVTQVGL